MENYYVYMKGLEVIFKSNLLLEMSLCRGFQEIVVQILHGFYNVLVHFCVIFPNKLICHL